MSNIHKWVSYKNECQPIQPLSSRRSWCRAKYTSLKRAPEISRFFQPAPLVHLTLTHHLFLTPAVAILLQSLSLLLLAHGHLAFDTRLASQVQISALSERSSTVGGRLRRWRRLSLLLRLLTLSFSFSFSLLLLLLSLGPGIVASSLWLEGVLSPSRIWLISIAL